MESTRLEMCSGSEAGSYARLIDFVYHATLGLRVIITKGPRDVRLIDFWTLNSSEKSEAPRRAYALTVLYVPHSLVRQT